jgi:hypothetical protein
MPDRMEHASRETLVPTGEAVYLAAAQALYAPLLAQVEGPMVRFVENMIRRCAEKPDFRAAVDAARAPLLARIAELETELDGRSDEAAERWIQKQLAETGLRMADFRNGMSMELEVARDLVAAWCGAARAMLGDAPNYSETPITMTVKVGESPETFAFTLQRVGALTPHQARLNAEAERDAANARITDLEAEVARLGRTLVVRSVLNNGGPDA